MDYLNEMEDKIITLYDYNPNNKIVPNEKRIEIIKQQLRYEKEQAESLKIISKGNYTGNFDAVERKTKKVEELKNKLKELKSKTPPPPPPGDER